MKVQSPSQQLRAALWLLWNARGCPGEWEDFYRSRMARLTKWVLAKIDAERLDP